MTIKPAVTLSQTEFSYNGKAIKQVPFVKNGKKKLNRTDCRLTAALMLATPES